VVPTVVRSSRSRSFRSRAIPIVRRSSTRTTPSVSRASSFARSRPAADTTVPFSVTTPFFTSTSMSLPSSASSPTNCVFTFVWIHASLIRCPAPRSSSRGRSAVVRFRCCSVVPVVCAVTGAESATATPAIVAKLISLLFIISTSPHHFVFRQRGALEQITDQPEMRGRDAGYAGMARTGRRG
jgi:hypothetical protein